MSTWSKIPDITMELQEAGESALELLGQIMQQDIELHEDYRAELSEIQLLASRLTDAIMDLQKYASPANVHQRDSADAIKRELSPVYL